MPATSTDTTAVSIGADDLPRAFGSITALDGVDVTVEEPEIVGLVGPNGAGKTTLIRCLLGLLDPTAGSSSISGTQSSELDRTARAQLGYMPQDVAVYRDLSVRENVAFLRASTGSRTPERRSTRRFRSSTCAGARTPASASSRVG
ncbi:MAG: ATP-binding cassette domain-containing protein [Halovenus sp.]